MVRLPCDEPTDDSGRQVEQLVEPSISKWRLFGRALDLGARAAPVITTLR